MSTMVHCIQCKDMHTGKIGSFIYSNDKPFYATSPVFSDLVGLYTWMIQNGWTSAKTVDDMRVYRTESL